MTHFICDCKKKEDSLEIEKEIEFQNKILILNSII